MTHEHDYRPNAIRARSMNPDDLTAGYTKFSVCVICGDVREVDVPPEGEYKWAEGGAS